MSSPDEFDPRAFLEGINPDEASWLAGLVITTTAGEEIEGIFQRIENDAALMSTAGGERVVPIDSIASIAMVVESPGPE